MKKFFLKALYLGIVLGIAGLAGCQNPFEPIHKSTPPSQGKGRVVVTVGDSATERTIAPTETLFTHYTLTFSGPAQVDPIEVTGASVEKEVELVVGSWTITATGHTGTAGNYAAVAEGSAAVTVSSGDTASLNILLGPKTGGDPGTFSYTLKIPNGLGSAQLIISTPAGVGVRTITLTYNASGISGSETLNPGEYLARIRLEKGGLYAGLTEALHIYSGLTSALPPQEYTDDDFRAAVSGSFALTVDHLSGDFMVYVVTTTIDDSKLATVMNDDLVARGEANSSPADLKWSPGSGNGTYNVIIASATGSIRYQNGVTFTDGSGSVDWSDMTPVDIAALSVGTLSFTGGSPGEGGMFFIVDGPLTDNGWDGKDAMDDYVALAPGVSGDNDGWLIFTVGASGGTFDPNGTYAIIYTDDEALKYQNNVTFSGGNATIDLSSMSNFEVSEADLTLVSIDIDSPPTKTTYTQSEAFTSAGLVVSAAYRDGSSGNVTGYTLRWNGSPLAENSTAITATTGTKTITVAYRGQTTTFDIFTNPPASVDTTPPANVTDLNAFSEDNKVDLTWTDPADEDFDHVEITVSPTVDGITQPITITGAQTHSFTGLVNGITYTFTVKTVDTTGNKSAGTAKTAIPGNPVAAIAEYLATVLGGNSAHNPVPLKAALNLTAEWQNLLKAIQTAGKYVSLDLTACAMANMTGAAGEFNPGTANTGESLIVSLVLPAAATKIVDYANGAFRYFTSLKNVKGSAVTTIGYWAFLNCKSLTTADFPLVTSIGSYAFLGCNALTTADFPLVTSIGQSAFWSCNALTTANFPAATSIGESAFSLCNALTTANFPLVTSLGDRAFSSCAALTTADFPAATTIGESAFYNCNTLTTAYFPLVTSIGESAFEGCYALTTAYFPLVTSIGGYAFRWCSALKMANFPLVTSIGDWAFYNCYALTTADFPLVTSIGDYAFSGCRALTTANFPLVTSIGEGAFQATGNKALAITLPRNAPTLSSNASSANYYAKSVTVKTPAGRTGYDAAWEGLFKRAFSTSASIFLSFKDL